MNINKWLCKHFDDEKKGYVTIGDISTKISTIILLVFVALAALIMFGVFLGVIQGIPAPRNQESVTEFITFSAKGWVLPIEVLGFIVILYYLISKISKIKIAKCQLKEKEP